MPCKNPSARSVASEFTKRNDIVAFLAILSDWTFIFLLSILSGYLDSIAGTMVCLIGIGYFQYALGEAIVHDASHRNLFRITAWNDHLDFMYALPFLMTVRQWRNEHRIHHQNFGKDGDHILADYASFGLTTTARPNIYWICFGRPLCGLCAWDRLRWIIQTTTIADLKKITAFWLFILLICTVNGILIKLAICWFVPLIIIFPTFLYWSEIGDHYRTLSGTRSRTGFWYNFLWHNSGYHSLHHRYPRIPFHQLPRAHRRLNLEDPDSVVGWFGLWKAISLASDSHPRGLKSYGSANDSSSSDKHLQ
jgi:fatty acid desaturase